MWSIGCILAEMITGKALFPGTSTLNQIERVLEVTGKPKESDLHSMESNFAHSILETIQIIKKKQFHNLFPTASPEALDLIKNTLAFNPSKRLTVEQALRHKYLKDLSLIQI
eukprot:TRINITY_DN51913_c0_g1_i1.p2 TRINITY_DN51913_c0_g1~~TRINITY_DN51913_c0_g1_i1.p2  ORF type:complete len:112 (-),score=22.65 TRINITY_DN51913_c0_g1_i1:70-405(-)